MKEKAYAVILAVALLFITVSAAHGQLTIRTIDVAGDSISKGFNAGSAFPCANADQENCLIEILHRLVIFFHLDQQSATQAIERR